MTGRHPSLLHIDPDGAALLPALTDISDGIFRYLSDILVEHAGYPQNRFWELVAACILDYQQTHPPVEARTLFAPEFARSCLNRLQLCNNRQMIDLTDPAANLQLAGTLENPVAPFKTTSATSTGSHHGSDARQVWYIQPDNVLLD